MCKYRVADIILQIEKICLDEVWKKFSIFERNLQAQAKIQTVYFNYESYNIKGCVFSENIKRCFTYDNMEVVFVDNSWTNIQILFLQDMRRMNTFLIQIFYTHAVQRRMIQIHSSMIDYQGKGLLFLGPSGIGKTTMAELWNKYRNALIINGDMNFVQETEECFLGWGTPWHGSSPYCENANVPVCALIVLKQAQENSIRRLEGFEKVQLVSNNIIYPTWLENGMELCLETLDHLLSSLPVYELSCRPDEDAVRLTEKTIFN